ncbi:FadR/GntR family transcriptional regulator [Agromyces albus]|uniref:FadR/GntR family transcriptional regulator n=1 Tax=Agromyces albus TaxID=205332 RepID=UPI00278ADB73|nr:FCD domain-containing protein [Agromyces albus]MDQ0577093.1 DNA-binding FadR family transcriptional regulator [Agromyces albus]
MSQLARLDSVSRVEVLQFRLLLEGSATRLAARNRSEADLDLIRARHRELEASIQADGAKFFSEHVSRFHASIRRASGNQLIEICGNVIGGITAELMVRRLHTEADQLAIVQRSALDGARLVEAISARDAEGAAAIQVANIHRFYADDLDPAEVDALRPFIDAVVE